jgi:phospholipase C
MRKLKTALLSTAALVAVAAVVTSNGQVAAQGVPTNLNQLINLVDQFADHDHRNKPVTANQLKTATPIKHLVVIFDENRSFDHYFGTYPNAQNVEGEPLFEPAKNTPRDINNLNSNPALTANNPNLNVANGAGAANPFRLDRTQADTADQSHNYTREQQAYDSGKNDLFPLDVGKGGFANGTVTGSGTFFTTGQVMGYFDGNTVTALWNYAQNFAMSDAAFTDTYGPSTPGLLNMWAGQTNGATFPVNVPGLTPAQLESNGIAVQGGDASGSLTLIQDIDPVNDVCSRPGLQVTMTGKNVGDLLNKANIPWGSFVGGFDLQTVNAGNGSTGCQFNNPGQTGGRSSISSLTGIAEPDYVPHHIWFQYYASTANPKHTPPASTAEIGHDGPANHAYDLAEFKTAVGAGNFPAVSFLKQSAFQDGHPRNSNPLDEQQGLVDLVNFLQQQPDWDSTAIIFTYDDSDGQYDHVAPPITSPSFSTQDATNGTRGSNACGTGTAPAGLSGSPVNGRCGPGFRIPFLVISPFAKKNHVSHTLITQASVTKFIEDNWLKSERLGGGSFDATAGSIMDMFDFHQGDHDRKVILDGNTGLVVKKSN